MKQFFTSLTLLAISLPASAQFVLEWDKIEHWAGDGDNRSALIVQFSDDGPDEAYVWGYRWPSGEERSGEDMFRAIAEESDDIVLFTQFTGQYGSTVCGIGLSTDNGVIPLIHYDFDSACEDDNISFDYFTPNTMMGQTTVPGWDTPDICQQAIFAAEATHIIDHPINCHAYGYPAYDYDWWQPSETLSPSQMRWHAGWYRGYWSYWTGKESSESLGYSGVGFTGRKLANNSVDGWVYTYLEPGSLDTPDGVTSASTLVHPLNYSHIIGTTSVKPIKVIDNTLWDVYNLQGVKVASRMESNSGNLPAGIYIARSGDITKKIYIK